MSRLKMTLLGPFQVILGGTLISSFKSNKIRALLAYLPIFRYPSIGVGPGWG